MNGIAKKSLSHAAHSSITEPESITLHALGKFFISEDEDWDLPFQHLPGETHEWAYNSKDNYIILTNYRLLVCLPETFYNMPIQNIEQVEMRDLLELWVNCKDGRAYRMSFDTPEASSKWWQYLTTVSSTPLKIEKLFAFTCFKTVKKMYNGLQSACQNAMPDASAFISELKRLDFDTRSIWRISEINSKFEICPSYPKFHIVPAWTSDKDLTESARFRSIGRFPTIVWRNTRNGAVLARASQPEVGVFGWRCNEDEKLLSSIARSALLNSWTHDSLDSGKANKSLLIVDARSYTAAFANRAKGGGFEYQEYYLDCQVQFMSLTNIHGIRKSFHSLRSLCQFSQEQSSWMSALEATKWLQYLSVLLRSASLIVNVMEKEGQSVLVHCSDGWDRTAQLASLAEILMDPFYRTIKGFQILIEREWLDFGHKFGDRCGHSPEGDTNERSPVFLQWLDCIHQLLKQFPTAFEFNEHFLVKLVVHAYSCLYGTFLCNSAKERQELKIKQNTSSIWTLFRTFKPDYKNLLYYPNQRVLYPTFHLRSLLLWESVYMPKTPCFLDCTDNDNCYDSEICDVDCLNGETDMHFSTNNLKEKIKNSSKGEEFVSDCNGLKRSSDLNGVKDDDCNVKKELEDTHEDKVDVVKNNNHENVETETSQGVKDLKINVEEDGVLPKEHCDSLSAVEEIEDEDGNEEDGNVEDGCRRTIVEDENMKRSMTSSTKTITSTSNDIELQALNLEDKNQSSKTGDNPNSEPSTPKGGKFKGHRRTHSSDESPLKNVIKTTSYSEGMSAPTYYSQENCDMPASVKALSNPMDNVRLIDRFLSHDGMLTCEDRVQQRLREMHSEYRGEVKKLQKRVELERQARIAMVYRRDGSQSETASSRRESENIDDICSLSDSLCTDVGSMSSMSNNDSWENVQFEDAQATRWVPDHVSNSCATCDLQFNLVIRKHHCRKCGRIFCSQCAHRYLPLPDEQLYEPVRVCNECFRNHCTSS